MKGLFTQTLLALIYWPWAKLKEFVSGLFSDDAEQTEKAQQGEGSGDGSGRLLPEASQEERVHDPNTEREKDIAFTRDAIAENAELYETSQPDLMADYSGDPGLFIEAAYHVDWPAVVGKYHDDTIYRILGDGGTNFDFPGHPNLKKTILAAVRTESAKRTPEPRATNGMVD
jgi:hypothetical protein